MANGWAVTERGPDGIDLTGQCEEVSSRPTFGRGFCGSGDGIECNFRGNARAQINCAYADDFVSDDTTEIVRVFDVDSQWTCGGRGQNAECPNGHVVVGVCGSGGNSNDCSAVPCINSPAQRTHAVQCARVEGGLFVNTADNFWTGVSTGNDNEYGTCSEGYVYCGQCQSAGSAACGGSWNTIKCCRIEACSPGRYTSDTITACSSCGTGRFAYYPDGENHGAFRCDQCPTGSVAAAESSSCTECPAGTYSETDRSSCSNCPAGRARSTSSGFGIDSCEICAPGEFSEEAALTCSVRSLVLFVCASCVDIQCIQSK